MGPRCRMRGGAVLALFSFGLAFPLAGCVGPQADPAGPSEVATTAGAPAASADGGLFWENLTTPFVAGDAHAHEFDWVVPGPYVDTDEGNLWFRRIPDAFRPDEFVLVRATLSWTNEPTNHASLDLYPSGPHAARGCAADDDESALTGPQTAVAEYATGWEEGWTDAIGVCVTSAAISTGLSLHLLLELFPVERAVPGLTPHRLVLPEGAEWHAEFVRPHGPGPVRAGVLLFDASDRPLRYESLEGEAGSRVRIDLAPGEYVFFIDHTEGGVLRMAAALREASSAASVVLERLQLEDEWVTVADLAGEAQVTGGLEFTAPPGTVSLRSGLAWRSAEPISDYRFAHRYHAVLTSSSGALDELSTENVVFAYVRGVFVLDPCAPGCGSRRTYDATKLLDDDGTYRLDYEGEFVGGEIFLSLQRYVR